MRYFTLRPFLLRYAAPAALAFHFRELPPILSGIRHKPPAIAA
ncbi:hypothetical protein [Klebsiella pneumoniae IS46]|uniref:Uncharacterized protein n=1 Tax=Klebsiella pneumoniae IS43 TaxID=1432552 RepID=W1DSA0_KLEPN|nr:hypothetical protein KPNJ1_01106 [Klebsiella pneumoniae 30660/NJST258_1]ESB00987.1 hypothetical protein HMPREF1619_02834 [Klebsiella pneumoniae 909957]KXA27146.1 hypothetical protein HMPREF3197_01901 [Klebsiella pneumoniae]CDL10994.1 hypothetical protein [Klebsiella pneumoniae IS43]CDL13795.1 hypothetical protein [Klebsiella pneumoniae IS46]CDL43070.1 hypothetical protein [Klebsiella pneumoniae ISC21]